MWTFVQRTGAFLTPDGSQLTVGYSGNWDGVPPPGGSNDHRNKPADQSIKSKGPIPVGQYTIGVAFNDPGGKGPIVMALTPDPANRMFGRSAFLIHGDRARPRSGTASDGCIILDHTSRQTISDSRDRALRVIADADARFNAQTMALTDIVLTAKKATKKAPRKASKTASRRPVGKVTARPNKAAAKGAPRKKAVKAGATAPQKPVRRTAQATPAAKNTRAVPRALKKNAKPSKDPRR